MRIFYDGGILGGGEEVDPGPTEEEKEASARAARQAREEAQGRTSRRGTLFAGRSGQGQPVTTLGEGTVRRPTLLGG